MLLREGETWRLYAPVAERAQRPGAASRTRALHVGTSTLLVDEVVRDLATPTASASVRSALRAIGDPTLRARGTQRGHDEEVDLRRQLERALERGLLIAERIPRTPLPLSAPERDTEPPPAAAATSAVAEETTWIAIELVDDSDPPRPVPYARYRVTLPDGSAREGSLDVMGLARIDGIDPGVCKVSFLDIDSGEWTSG